MSRHVLKIWPTFYSEVKSGNKTFEYRKNDRDYKTGDMVELHEWAPVGDAQLGDNVLSGDFTDSCSLTFKIGHILHLPNEMCVFALLPVEP